jgi:tetratricopeptide (TPR) repeat protein
LETQLAWKELPVVGSYGRMLDPSQTVGREKSNRVRILIWEGVVELISPHEPLAYPDGSDDTFNFLRPLIGYGPESMYVVYNRYYPPELASVEARNATPDRSHNETFDALVITGLAGFLAWQALYVSVFYYGFRYLGVVGSRRDRNILIGAWIGGGLLGGILSLIVLDPIFFGVAVPTGTIVGLVGYLFYFALFSKGDGSSTDESDRRRLPFHVDRLLMNGLLAAVLAHYVEIHFGIAISSTRMYFFLYVASMFLISYKFPKEKEHSDIPVKRKRRAAQIKRPNRIDRRRGPALMWSFLLALIVGILGFEYTNYILPAGEAVATGSDLSAVNIFSQSLFINAQKGFLDSPFIYLMIVLTWALGCLIALSEMVRQKELTFTLKGASSLLPWRRYLAAVGLGLLAFSGLAARFILAEERGASPSFGSNVALIGAIACVWAAVFLLQDKRSNRIVAVGFAVAGLLLTLVIPFSRGWSPGLIVAAVFMAVLCLWAAFRPLRDRSEGRFTALAVAASGLALSLPIMIAGGWLFGFAMAIICVLILVLLWDETWRPILLPSLVLGVLSWTIGIGYTFIHAVNMREALLYLIFYQGIEPISSLFTLFLRPAELIESVQQLRVLEATQSMRFLSVFYVFLFAMLVLSGISLAWHGVSRVRSRGSVAGYAVLVVAAILGIIAINQTNLRVVQADMVYKRGKPFDDQALRQNDPVNWDIAIAIYEKALDLAPLEDFYYLFLGRAFLERSATSSDKAEQTSLYNKAEEGLLQAQTINPLNTDHTANLARLYTRWYATDPDSDQNTSRLEAAEGYYQDALELSPHNSIIRNEYARLAFELKQNCDQTLALYEESLTVDPFYSATYFALTDALVACAAAQSDEATQNELYTLAAQSLAEGLLREPENARAWLQSGQILQQIGDYEAALASFERARETDLAGTIPSWNIDFAEAMIYHDMGELALARAMAEQARQFAPSEVADQIEAFIAGLEEE